MYVIKFYLLSYKGLTCHPVQVDILGEGFEFYVLHPHVNKEAKQVMGSLGEAPGPR